MSQVTITINVTPGVEITSGTPPNTTVGEPYSFQFTGNILPAGTPGTLTWAVIAGELPPGLVLNPDGSMVGPATTVGSYQATIQPAIA